MKDEKWPGQPKNIEDAKSEALLDEISCQTQKELAMELKVDRSTISYHMHKINLKHESHHSMQETFC